MRNYVIYGNACGLNINGNIVFCRMVFVIPLIKTSKIEIINVELIANYRLSQ